MEEFSSFDPSLLELRNYIVSFIDKKEVLLVPFVVDLYYNNSYVGYAKSGGSVNDISIEILPQFEKLDKSMWAWVPSTELLVTPNGEIATLVNDIAIYIDGLVAKWVKSQFI